MSRFIDEICFFLQTNGFDVERQIRCGHEVICTTGDGGAGTILPVSINARTPEEAAVASRCAYEAVLMIKKEGRYPLILVEDRWRNEPSVMKARLLAHLQVFSQAFARNCTVKRIEKAEAQEFLKTNHSYGDAACKYRYGLFLKRHSGHLVHTCQPERNEESLKDKLIAVATFSNARKWVKDGKEIRSYEWTRYASLPDLRVSGGMGKLLKAFIKDVKPDDIMSYADLEWSEGGVYERLGFKLEGRKEPVMFAMDEQWRRIPVRPAMAAAMEGELEHHTGDLYFRNFGSNKYRLKLTDYR